MTCGIKDRWTNLSFVLTGPAVRHYLEVFQSDWLFACGETLNIMPPSLNGSAVSGQGGVQVIPSGPDVPDDPIYDALLTAVFAAKKNSGLSPPIMFRTKHWLRPCALPLCAALMCGWWFRQGPTTCCRTLPAGPICASWKSVAAESLSIRTWFMPRSSL